MSPSPQKTLLQIAFRVGFRYGQKIHQVNIREMFSVSGWISLTTGESFGEETTLGSKSARRFAFPLIGAKSRFLTIFQNSQNPTPMSYVNPKDQLHAASAKRKAQTTDDG